uniref:Uncharacterized protein n=1 Tax=Aegilops tauschii TaxID=37682 RepID=N1R0T0_AEGTA
MYISRRLWWCRLVGHGADDAKRVGCEVQEARDMAAHGLPDAAAGRSRNPSMHMSPSVRAALAHVRTLSTWNLTVLSCEWPCSASAPTCTMASTDCLSMPTEGNMP